MQKIFALSFVFLLAFSSCKKYPDGPAISLETKTIRLCNTWKPGTVYENGTDMTADFNSNHQYYSLSFYRHEGYELVYLGPYTFYYDETGDWIFTDDKTHVRMSSNNLPSVKVSDWTILRLKEKELWVRYTENGTTYEIHFVPK